MSLHHSYVSTRLLPLPQLFYMYVGSNLHYLSKKMLCTFCLRIFEDMTISCFLTENALQNVHTFCVQNLKLQYKSCE
jgi:hypothetical protein